MSGAARRVAYRYPPERVTRRSAAAADDPVSGSMIGSDGDQRVLRNIVALVKWVLTVSASVGFYNGFHMIILHYIHNRVEATVEICIHLVIMIGSLLIIFSINVCSEGGNGGGGGRRRRRQGMQRVRLPAEAATADEEDLRRLEEDVEEDKDEADEEAEEAVVPSSDRRIRAEFRVIAYWIVMLIGAQGFYEAVNVVFVAYIHPHVSELAEIFIHFGVAALFATLLLAFAVCKPTLSSGGGSAVSASSSVGTTENRRLLARDRKQRRRDMAEETMSTADGGDTVAIELGRVLEEDTIHKRQ